MNNAGIFRVKPFTEFTTEDENAPSPSTNLFGFLYVTQLTVKHMLKQKSGQRLVTITASLADQPHAGENASVSMITKGGLNTITRHLAIEYAKDGIRFNAVAPGVVDTPLHENDSKEALEGVFADGKIAEAKYIVAAVLYVAEAEQVTGEIKTPAWMAGHTARDAGSQPVELEMFWRGGVVIEITEIGIQN